MTKSEIYSGNTKLHAPELKVKGEFIDMDGERYYRISNYDRMPPFLMSIVSASDQWMFISSNGALTAGRKNPGGAIFPYYTEDKIHDFKGKTGSRTIILVKRSEKVYLWEPFTDCYPSVYSIKRNIYKNRYGNKLIFQEINDDLSLTFQYGWFNSDQFGFVKNSILINHGNSALIIDMLDGIQNILPCGVDHNLQVGYSYLVDAYKRSELIAETGLGIFRLSSIPVDTAEPSEALKVTTVWSEGLSNTKTLLSNRQLDLFKTGSPVETETDMKALKGAFFVHAQFDLSAGEEKEWNMVAEVDRDAADVAALISMLRKKENIRQWLLDDIDRSTEHLIRIIASSDGIQFTGDEMSTSHHLSNVLFNVMRGGLFEQNYDILISDFLSFISKANKKILGNAESLVASSGEIIQYAELLNRAWDQDNPNLIRLCYEYLPVSFSRRHGDPSRPWNLFSIETKNEDGTKNFSYQGNWRDIFQNWEALSLSFPGFAESMICKFVNASTPDGFNPYRITRDGIDWEKPDPSDPWSNIGYWGDHQIVYLLKFLEISVHHHPELLRDFLAREIFSYANVPYRIKPYRDLVKEPRNTIEFDAELDGLIEERVVSKGADGKLVWNKEGDVIHVNLSEKLMVTMLAKISNFIPGAGIWMNTQRPEWNDANNALVGYGVSMVTTFNLRRFINFCITLFASAEPESVMLSEEVVHYLKEIAMVLALPEYLSENRFSGQGSRKMMDALGTAGSDYRQRIYNE
jgi:hypothetical protein